MVKNISKKILLISDEQEYGIIKMIVTVRDMKLFIFGIYNYVNNDKIKQID